MPNVEIICERDRIGLQDTTSRAYVDGEFLCYFLEDAVRLEKIRGVTAIFAGRYELVWTRSPRFGRFTLELLKVREFVGVRIHPGNDSEDTEGCPLPGSSRRWKGRRQWVSASRKANKKVEAICRTAFGRGERCFITFKNVQGSAAEKD